MRISFSWIFIFSLVVSCSNLNDKPNFIIILTDDQGWGDLELTGNPVLKTPNLNNLAESGSLFNSFYSEKLSISSKVKVFENFQYLLSKILNKKNILDKMFISMIEKSLDDPSSFKMKNNKTNLPDGSPIGSFLCY